MMKISFKKGMIAAGGSALLIVLTTGATSDEQPGSDVHSVHYRVSVSSQYSKPLSERTGAWTCVGALSGQNMSPAASGHCKPHQSWCWTLKPGAGRSTWMGGFKYGFGRKKLGTVEVFYEVALNGRESVSKPVRFVSTGNVRHVITEGDRLFYDSNHTAGKPISPRVDDSYLHHPANVAARKAVEWPGGYDAFEKSPVRYGAVIHTWTWNVAGYPSTWFVFGKSIHYYFRGKRAFFFKQWQKHLGAQPVGWGANG
jgi:hypothetical protein